MIKDTNPLYNISGLNNFTVVGFSVEGGGVTPQPQIPWSTSSLPVHPTTYYHSYSSLRVKFARMLTPKFPCN